MSRNRAPVAVFANEDAVTAVPTKGGMSALRLICVIGWNLTCKAKKPLQNTVL
jgi:hypothetical protein